MKEGSDSLTHEHLLELANGIRVVGAKKENKLNSEEQTVVAIIRDLVVHLVEGKSFEEDYQVAGSVGELPAGTRVMLGVGGWLETFGNEEYLEQRWGGKGYPLPDFEPEKLGCELALITGRDSNNEWMIKFQSLSSKWRLTGLREKDMNKKGITGQERIALLQQALTSGKLGIKFFDEQIISGGSGWGPVITGKKL
ncbi:hypothetical protein L6272_02045 [Microgenomates group bacterium]|nr:hypothetical protein [Microgenomates group bacterium]